MPEKGQDVFLLRGNLKDLDVVTESEDFTVREACWGDMHVEHGSFKKEMDGSPLLKGLPDDRCQSPHWGYVLKGSIRVNYPDREEVIKAGETYYMEPGHRAIIGADTDYLEFSPEEGYHRTMEVMMKNIEAMQGK
jgi:hypothetical protein